DWNAIADGRYYVEWSALVVARTLASAPLDTLLMLQYSLCAGPFRADGVFFVRECVGTSWR
ncbi:MAG: hypothetical protein DMG58_14955, partial [Acidobacteria bacterium]